MWRVTRLDDALAPVEVLGRVRSISIERSAKERAPLLESASISFDAVSLPWVGGWHLIEHIDGSTARPYGVFHLGQRSANVGAASTTITAEGLSVLAPAADGVLSPGSYARSGIDAPMFAAELLGECPGSVSIAGSAILGRSIVFDEGCAALDAAWQVLDAVGWRIRLDGTGGIHLEPLPDAPAIRITRAEPHGVVPGIALDDGAPSYVRADVDEVRPLDLVAVNLPRDGVDGTWRVLTQSIEAGITTKVHEKLGEGRAEWQ